MILKLTGAILTVLATGIIGFQISAAYLTEVSQVKKFISILMYMENELTYRKTPLPDLFRNIAATNVCVLGDVFNKAGQLLDAQISPNAEPGINIALSETDGLSGTTVRLFKQLACNLGKFDVEGQVSGIRSVEEECKSALNLLEANKAEKIRSIKTLGICAGAAVAILLI